MKTKGGAIIPATVVTGRKIVQGPAMRIYNAASSPRLVKGGPSEPVIVVDEDDIVGLGGKYRIMGGPAVPMVNLSNRKVKGGAAIPVYPVDANGAYDSSFAGTYFDKVLATLPGNLIGFWPQNEAVGPASIDYSGLGHDGVYAGVTLGQPGVPGMGWTCPYFDGVNDDNDLGSAGLYAAFNGVNGTLIMWLKVPAASWVDGADTRPFALTGPGSVDWVTIVLPTTNNELRFEYIANSVAETHNENPFSDTNWFCAAMTWDKGADEVIPYINGAQLVIMGTLGVWSIAPWHIRIGSIAGGNDFTGHVGPTMLYDATLTPAQVAYLSTV